MQQKEIFGNAIWVGADADALSKHKIFILRGKFRLKAPQKAILRVLGLGIFHCYLNGKRVGEDLFLPLNSEFEPRNNFPMEETLSGFRMYVPEYDVTDLLHEGENTVAIHFGGGWYTYERECMFGYAKAIWRIFGMDEAGDFDVGSSEADLIAPGFVYDLSVPLYVDCPVERQDHLHPTCGATESDYDDSQWPNASLAVPPNTSYEFSACPADRACESLTPRKIFENAEKKCYDAGKNLSGYPVLRTMGKAGETVTVLFSEERSESGEIDPRYAHKQEFSLICDGTEQLVHPLFAWFGFRYFEIYGNAEAVSVSVVHANVERASSFVSDNDTLNWLYETYVNTQLTNMHTGIPSDCPHIERRGYTGDGQLVCHAAMTVLDAKEFYRKWMRDIADSQDVLSGHVQNTAPYTHSGGGPGGWGGAIVEVPYQFYRHYGEKGVLEEYYPCMLRYFDYLEARSEADLVVNDKKGEWCLGEWCPPHEIVLPLPFVNTYFYVKYLGRAVTVAKIIGKDGDIPALEAKIEKKKKALLRSYYNYNSQDQNFFGCRQAANAFMLDIGLGEKRTYPHTVAYYQRLGGFDTGIFGTDVLTRVLFEKGDAELAVRLLTSETPHSFAEEKKRGATTLWEYWPNAFTDRSHNHPMFGAVTAYLFDYLLGIREAENSLTYEKIRIQPMIVSQINTLSGHRRLEGGDVYVSYEKKEREITFRLAIPKALEATFVYNGQSYPLTEGETTLRFAMD